MLHEMLLIHNKTILIAVIHSHNTGHDFTLDHPTKPIFEPQTIEDTILQFNQKHFQQAQGTPCTQKEIKQLLQNGLSEYSN